MLDGADNPEKSPLLTSINIVSNTQEELIALDEVHMRNKDSRRECLLETGKGVTILLATAAGLTIAPLAGYGAMLAGARTGLMLLASILSCTVVTGCCMMPPFMFFNKKNDEYQEEYQEEYEKRLIPTRAPVP